MKKLVEKFQKIKFQIPTRLGLGIFLLGIFFSSPVLAQTAARWQQVYGGPGHEYGYRVRACMDQGYIVAGSTASAGVSDGYVVRTDSLGLVMWSKYYQGNNVDVLRSLCQLPDSGYIMAGYSNSAGNGGYDGWVLRTDKYGDTAWTRYIGTSDWDFFYDVVPTWDGGFVLAGGTYGLGAGDEDMYFVKLNSVGDTLWTKTYGGIEADEARAIIETNDSMLAACGFTYSLGDSLGDSWILRMDDLTGDTVWTRTAGYTANNADKAWSLCNNISNNTIFYCGQQEVAPGNDDAYFGAFNYSGSSVFIYSTGGGDDENFTSIITRPNGTFAMLGTNHTIGAGNGDFYFFHDRNGWGSYSYGTQEIDVAYSLDLAKDDGYIACGYTEGFNSFQPNIYLIKIDTAGVSPIILDIRDQSMHPASGSVSAFPNPANQQIQIHYQSLQRISSDLEMEIIDISGKRIISVPSSEWQSNTSNAAFCTVETSSLSAGVYFYTITDSKQAKISGKFFVTH